MTQKADMSIADIDRYVDWVKEFGVEKAQEMQKQVMKNKKKFLKSLSPHPTEEVCDN